MGFCTGQPEIEQALPLLPLRIRPPNENSENEAGVCALQFGSCSRSLEVSALLEMYILTASMRSLLVIDTVQTYEPQ